MSKCRSFSMFTLFLCMTVFSSGCASFFKEDENLDRIPAAEKKCKQDPGHQGVNCAEKKPYFNTETLPGR